MSSLAAARADNFYNPPDWDPGKEGRNQYQGSHGALGDRARKLHKGILIIRFEVPFNMWCDGCGALIGKGVRFNADKKQIGNYLSTKIWSFTMRHHCGCEIEIITDPKNTQYIIERGAKRKEEEYAAEDAQVLELPDDAERARLASDPIYRMERQSQQKLRADVGRAQVADLLDMAHKRGADGNDLQLNKQLKRRLRDEKKADAALDCRRQALGLPDHIKLLPETHADAAKAAAACPGRVVAKSQHERRKSILRQDIFAGVCKKKHQGSSRHHASGLGHAGVKKVSTKGKVAKLARHLKR